MALHVENPAISLKDIEDLHTNSKYFEAETKLKEFRKNHPDFNLIGDEFWFVPDLEKKCEQLRGLKVLMNETEGWDIAREADDWKTEYKPDPEKGFHNFRVSGVTDLDLFKIAAVCLETELFYNWLPFCTESNVIARTAELGRLGQFIFGLWWPLEDRELILDAFGCDSSVDGDILVFAQSITEHPLYTIPQTPQGKSRIYMIQAGFYFKCLENGKVKLVIVAQVDPGVPYVPQFLLNFISGKAMHLLPQELVKAANFDEDSEYAERIRNNPKLYDRARAVVSSLQGQGKNDLSEAKVANPVKM